MKADSSFDISPMAQHALEVLQQAVNEALEKKRKLGQYAVVENAPNQRIDFGKKRSK